MVFHLTQKLRKKLKVEPEPGPHAVANPLLRWYAHLFYSKREQWILATNEATLLSLLMPGRGLSNPGKFAAYFHVLLEDYLELLLLREVYEQLVAPHAGELVIAKTESRVMLSSMNDTIYCSKHYVCNADFTILELTDKASNIPKSAISQVFPLYALADLIERELPEFARVGGWDRRLRRYAGGSTLHF
ncbi:hypothetical protein JW859_04720 [bacterium]|nr:hypothetical protein [bacterium]